MEQNNTYIPKRARNLVALSVTHSPPTPPTLAFCSAEWFESFDGDRLADAIEMITLLETHELLVTWGGLAPVRDAAEAHTASGVRRSCGRVARFFMTPSRTFAARYDHSACVVGSEPVAVARSSTREWALTVAEAIRTSAVAYILNERPAAPSSMSEGLSSGPLACGDCDD